jgi:hypothetical protein
MAKKKKNSGVGAMDVGTTNRALSDQEKKKIKAREKAKMSALHRRDKEFLKDFENESDSDVRGHLLGKHAEDGLNLLKYGADAQAGRSFGQKTRAEPYKKYRNGGMVEGYEYGGEVGGSSRGGGAAVSGTKFSGVK